jgi:hypothetical protein
MSADEATVLLRSEQTAGAIGAVHTLANRSEAPARYLLLCTPAGFERHFARIAARQRGAEPPEWALAPYPEVRKVGPPIEG